jgi:hypothetical protein
VSGIALLICSIALAVVSIRGDGFRDKEFLVGGVLLIAVGGFLSQRRSLLAGVEAAGPPTTTLRSTMFEILSGTARVSCVVVILAGVAAATFDGWDFTAAALAGGGVEQLIEAEWLRYQERAHGCRLLEPPNLLRFEREKEWRPWRQRAAAREPATFFLDPAR